jgi:glutathione S-transferase
MDSMMLKLYTGAWSRAALVKWYLEEIGLPYEFVEIAKPAHPPIPDQTVFSEPEIT